MKPNYQIEAELMQNQTLFDDPFFRRHRLRTAATPLALTEQISKDYLFPTFYRDVSCAIGVFLCDYDQAKKLLPHPDMKPVSIPGNRALVTFSCYEYRQVLGIPAYNEIAMTIPVMVDPLVNIPVLPMVMPGFRKFGYYVFHMPVTSLENRIRGQKIWGLPKQVETIDIRSDNAYAETSAIDGSGNHYFSLTVPTQGKSARFDVKSNLYSRLGDKLLQSQTCFCGDFNINKYGERLWKKGGDDPGLLVLGDGPYGQMLQSLNIDPRPFQFRYTPSMNACFDLPNLRFKAPFDFTGIPQEAAS